MDVVIMGAGLSGLACAITLERYGVNPTIFEKRSCVGDRFVNAEALFSILDRPIKNSIQELAEKHKIDLNPINEVNRLVFHSKNQLGSIDGNIGYTNIRGRHEDSFERKLAQQVKSEIRYNSNLSYEDIAAKHEAVVLATGDGAYAQKLGNYRCDLTISLKGATVEGIFGTSMPHVWFNYEILPKGYAWLIPFSQSEANLVIAYPDCPETESPDINEKWNTFYNLAQKTLSQDLKITDQFQVTQYMAGICHKPKIDNTYFVGNCFGALSPGLGFGQFNSILTGIFAAMDICGLKHYEESVKPLFENYEHSLTLRRRLEKMDDDDFDLLVKSMDLKVLKAFISHVFSSESSFDLLKWLTPFL